MFTVFLINFGYNLSGTFFTLDDAKAAGRKAGFEFSVKEDGRHVGSWSVFGGWSR